MLRHATAQLWDASAEKGGMMNCALFARALLRVSLSIVLSCTWSEAQPTLVFQLSQVARGRLTEETRTRTRELAFTAALSMALDQAEVLSADEAGAAPAGWFGSSRVEPAALSCERAPPALCAWARSAEESAFVAALEHVEVEP